MREIDTLSEFKNWIDGADSPEPAVIQSLELSSCRERIHETLLKGSIFIGCKLDAKTAGHIVASGGMVFSDVSTRSFSCHRAHLYSPFELFESFDRHDPKTYHDTPDRVIYDEYMADGKSYRAPIDVTLMRQLHDHSISDALVDMLDGKKVVAIMGGHSMVRASDAYLKVARIARTLTMKGYLMVSGGGPGAMEATNLGAYFAAFSEEDLVDAVNILKVRPEAVLNDKDLVKKEYLDEDWLARAFAVLEKYPLTAKNKKKAVSIGIPTWFYGHEPPSPFSTHIAKYFANSIREDGLLEIATHGVIFAPGSAGTTQEIFQDACQNHYGTFQYISPMILMGEEHWTKKIPVWPLLKHVSAEKKYGELIALTDDADEIVQRILTYDPEKYLSVNGTSA